MAAAPILLDLSRTVSRARADSPSGADRIEAAWARRLAGDPAARFLVTAGRRHSVLDGAGARALLDALMQEAELPPPDLIATFSHLRTERQRRAESLARRLSIATGEDLPTLVAALPARPVWLAAGQAHVGATRLAELRRGGIAAAVAMVHDASALDRPELFPVDEPTQLLSTLATAALCDGIVWSSRETERLATPFLEAAPPARVAPPGADPLPETPPRPEDRPRFVMRAPVTPRRNHLGMLWIWQRLHAELGDHAPHLHLIGPRGREAGMVHDILDRSPMIGRCVFEHQALDDAAAAGWVRGARAVLAPSFVEGHGLFAAEALASGAPVIAAETPALRELLGDAPDWIDPLDLPGWLEAVLTWSEPGAPARERALERVRDWTPPSWEAHFDTVLEFAARLAEA